MSDLRASTVTAGTLPVVDVSNDPNDNDLLAMAIAGPADFLITGDKRDLLAIGAFSGTKITTVRQFLTMYD